MKSFLISALLLFMVSNSGKIYAETVNEIINHVKKEYAADKRQEIWDIKAYNSNGNTIVKGVTSSQKAYDAFTQIMQKNRHEYLDSIKIYPSDQWGLVRISVAHLRERPSHSAEIVSQAIMGTPLRLLEKNGEWWRVQSPDGYISYIIGNSLFLKSEEQMQAWRKSNRVIVTSFDQIRVFNSNTSTNYRDMVTDLVNGCIVEVVVHKKDKTQILLPDGRTGWVDSETVAPIENWAQQPFNSEKILETGYSMIGTPYLWGGMSTKSLDCSGFARVCYFANGYILMRDASQQALTGTRIEAENWRQCQAGDLLFFGNAKTRKVTHVAIYDNDGDYIHSSGRVKCNSVDPKSQNYLKTPFLHAVRIKGNEGTAGITKVSDHLWYFNEKK